MTSVTSRTQDLKHWLLAASVLVGIGCNPSHSDFNRVSVDALSNSMGASKHLVVVDANGASTRQKYGVIPGAILLSDYSKFEPSEELPSDKATDLVFYCSSKMCSAAPKAAERAAGAGYTSVSVLPDGIKGWVEAGKPVDAAPSS